MPSPLPHHASDAPDGAMTLSRLSAALKAQLAPLGSEARDVARIIIEDLLGYDATAVVVNGDRVLQEATVSRLSRAAARVVAGEPVQYVVGKARFAGLDFIVTPATLIPRPETEALTDMIIDDAGREPDLRVLDVGTGSGCIAITLARALRFARVEAVDISAEALAVAADNARRLRAKVQFTCADALAMRLDCEAYDIIVSNPPYVCSCEAAEMDRRVLDHEPHSALFVPDDDPLLFYRAIAEQALRALRPGGKLYFEINPLHSAAMATMLTAMGYDGVALHRDYLGRVRYATATKPHRDA